MMQIDEADQPVELSVSTEFMDGWRPLPDATARQEVHISKICSVKERRRFRYSVCTDANKFIMAAQSKDTEALLRMIESGVNTSIADDKGRTALHVAANKGYKCVVELLLQHGANTNVADMNGNTPFQLASGTFKQDIQLSLLNRGLNMDMKSKPIAHPLSIIRNSSRRLQRLTKANISPADKRLEEYEHQRLNNMISSYMKTEAERNSVEAMSKLNSLTLNKMKTE